MFLAEGSGPEASGQGRRLLDDFQSKASKHCIDGVYGFDCYYTLLLTLMISNDTLTRDFKKELICFRPTLKVLQIL